MLFATGRGDAVGMPAGLAAVAGVGRLVLQLGAAGGRDPPHALALAPLIQEHAEVNRTNKPFVSHAPSY